jgi:hypothetical protein
MPWGPGIMEYWDTGFGGMISIFNGRYRSDIKIRSSSAFHTQSSKIPLFHHSMQLTKKMVAKNILISIYYRNYETF